MKKGSHLSPEHRKKIGEAHKGKILSPEHRKKIGEASKGRIPWMKGRHHSPETLKKISEALKGEKHPHYSKHFSSEHKRKLSVANKGENCYNWKGGVSFEPYCPKFNNAFKERVRAFFGYQCVECGTPQNGKTHIVHHVNYDKMMCCNDVKPLFVCLCSSCNSKANFNRQYWEQHFTEMIETYYGGKCYLSEEEMSLIKS